MVRGVNAITTAKTSEARHHRHHHPNRWLVAAPDDVRMRALAHALGVSRTISGLLVARGVADADTARALLNPSFDQLHEPALMLGVSTAVERIFRAIDAGERILIYGDYDVDGTMGTVVLRRALDILGARTGFHVPHRFTEGYGIRRDVLERARADGYRLVVSVDCGIRAHEPLEWAQTNGLDVIITDHHLPDEGEGAPPALAVLNPNQSGCAYPDKNLAGVGVAFKLIHALLRARGKEKLVKGFLKVVAIGTVADVAPLVGENRAIVALGLADLPKATNPGLRALMDVSGVGDGRGMSASDLGFRLGPRINAAGRMDAARAVVELFETSDATKAQELAQQLDARNRERQVMQRLITERAITELETSGDDARTVAVVAGDGWHRGVIGLAASKIVGRINRPCIVISLDEDGVGHGSARSTDAYHLLDGLTTCADLLEGFGGHAHAAGLAIRRERIPELRRRLNAHAAALLDEDDLTPTIHIDAELAPAALTLGLYEELTALEPFGKDWPRPVFMTRNLRVVGEPRVIKERHLKFHLAGADGRTHEALWWSGIETNTATPPPGSRIELAYTLETNTWRNETHLQLVIEDMKMGDG